jgi:hypothetical protein
VRDATSGDAFACVRRILCSPRSLPKNPTGADRGVLGVISYPWTACKRDVLESLTSASRSSKVVQEGPTDVQNVVP